ncbi:MAG: hypothetical protein KGM99_01000 [Burkholderiales bacterium]|nr:hypothetical protein [Burkholderiales bacterium]
MHRPLSKPCKIGSKILRILSTFKAVPVTFIIKTMGALSRKTDHSSATVKGMINTSETAPMRVIGMLRERTLRIGAEVCATLVQVQHHFNAMQHTESGKAWFGFCYDRSGVSPKCPVHALVSEC